MSKTSLPFWPYAKGGVLADMCGSPKKAKNGGGTCRLPAGFRTQHPGEGHCYLHGGNLPPVVKKLAHKRLMRTLVEQGYWLESDIAKMDRPHRSGNYHSRAQMSNTSVNYFEALDALMTDTMERVIDLREVVNQIPLEEHELRENRATLSRFDTERKMAATIAKDAIAADVDKRRLALDEAKADHVVRSLAAAAAAAELSPEQEERLREVLASELRQLPPETD